MNDPYGVWILCFKILEVYLTVFRLVVVSHKHMFKVVKNVTGKFTESSTKHVS